MSYDPKAEAATWWRSAPRPELEKLLERAFAEGRRAGLGIAAEIAASGDPPDDVVANIRALAGRSDKEDDRE